MNVIAIRGATTSDNNTTYDISEVTTELFQQIIQENNIEIDNIIYIIFSMTKDLNAIYPAKALRDKFDLSNTPLFCTQEADIHNSLEKCIRILMLVNSNLEKNQARHIYLKGAKKLRPDLIDK